nr:hypothetical protein [Tanacetum cinerariifolium]
MLKQREEKCIEHKQYQPEEIQELMSKLLEDARNINEELSDYNNSLSWNHPIFYDNDKHSREYLEKSSKEIAPDLPTEEPEYSLSMGDEYLSTIPEMESDELIKSSVENLVPIPRDIHFLEELLSNDSLPLPENESSNFDHHDDPSFPRPPPEPPDVEVFFDFEPN